ncbi:uncharacterized protein [Drosophila virilis]|uniref:Uncharacterized protein n=1 Tax=Drosophila virilis TaxID=7244 RepID=B4MCZ7_DROVI|nr:uncharacterized protein LOC6635587 [Drosophila virilis]EDW58069.1 uncharacterized protein Dvir_GJ15337 [Drosophila virilis]
MYAANKTPFAAKKLTGKRTVEQLFAKSKSTLLSWRNFYNILKLSPLGQRVLLPIDKLSVLQGCEYLGKLSRHKLSTEELATLQVLASILFLLPDEVLVVRNARETLLRKSFKIPSASLEPMLVHYFSQNLLEFYEMGRHISSFKFLITISKFIASKCAMGKAVAVCLMWSIVFEIAGSSIIIHQHRDLSELCSILDQVPLANTPIDRFCILLQTVGVLLHFMLCGNWLQEFLSYGYPFFYFRLLPGDCRNLQAWLNQALLLYKVRLPDATQRIQCGAKQLLASLEYLANNSAEWCLACRSGSDGKSQVCVLGDIGNSK